MRLPRYTGSPSSNAFRFLLMEVMGATRVGQHYA